MSLLQVPDASDENFFPSFSLFLSVSTNLEPVNASISKSSHVMEEKGIFPKYLVFLYLLCIDDYMQHPCSSAHSVPKSGRYEPVCVCVCVCVCVWQCGAFSHISSLH